MPHTPRQHASRLGDLASLPVVPAKEFARWEPATDAISHHQHAAGHPRSEHIRPADSADSITRLSEQEERFLNAVRCKPGQASSTYVKLAGIAPRAAAWIRGRLLELGLIRERKVNLKARGRPAIVLEPIASPDEHGSSSESKREGGHQ